MSGNLTSQNSLPYARSFTELVVYQKARALGKYVFLLTKKLPREEAFALTDQWRRSARRIGAQISEAWAKRRYTRHFVSKLTHADGEQNETQHWAIIAYDHGYITREEAHKIGTAAQEIGKMLGGMIDQAESFNASDSILRDTATPYFAPESLETSPLNTEH